MKTKNYFLSQMILVLCLIHVFNQASIAQSNLKTFISPNSEFQVQVPQNWTEEKSNSSLLILNDPSLKGRQLNFIKYKYEYDTDVTIEDVAKDILKSFKKGKNDNGDKLNNSDFFISNNNAKWWFVDYTSNQGTRYKSYQTIANKIKYSIYYICPEHEFSAEENLAKNVVASFSLSASPTPTTVKESFSTNNGKVGTSPNMDGTTSTNLSKAGTISPNVKILEVDNICPFFGSFAGIKKGTASTIINDKGELLFPFNKFDFSISPLSAGATSFNGYFPVGGNGITNKFYAPYYGTLGNYQKSNPVKIYGLTDITSGKNGFITIMGKIILESGSWTNAMSFDQEGYFAWGGTAFTSVAAHNYLSKLISEKYDGTKIVGKGNTGNTNYIIEGTTWDMVSNGNSSFSNGLVPAVKANYSDYNIKDENKLREARNKKIGYINRKGEFQIEPNYYAVAEFSEGVAFVCRINEFGNPVWGAIDTMGKLIIPFKFAVQPGRFSNGRALIKATGMEQIEYAFIDKKGNIVFTLPKNSGDTVAIGSNNVGNNRTWLDVLPPGPEPFIFNEGYTYVSIGFKTEVKKGDRDNFTYLLDTNGHYTPILKLLKKSVEEGDIKIYSAIQNGEFLFGYYDNQKQDNLYGIADVHGNIVIPPIFNILHLFEKESKIQLAVKTYIENGEKKAITGYIDRNGIFQMIVAKAKGGF